MSKGKYKRKRQHAQQKAKEDVEKPSSLEPEKMAQNNEEPAAETTKNHAKDKKPSRWTRFVNWVGNNKTFTDWCIAAFTFVLAAAAIYQFVIMGGQLGVMRTDQRAWLNVTERGSAQVITNAPLSATMSVTNTGKTPASNMLGYFYVEVVPEGGKPNFESARRRDSLSSGVIPPGVTRDVPIMRYKDDPAEAELLSQSEKNDLDNGRAWLAIHGIIWYEDVFHTRHWLRFCEWYGYKPGADYHSKNCTAYNSIDSD